MAISFLLQNYMLFSWCIRRS